MISALAIVTLFAFVDDAGRRVDLPAHPKRIVAAGPPAAPWIYAIAPDALLGWTRPFKGSEAELIPEPYKSLPVIGRLTGHGGTASLESLIAAKPDVIVDIGTVDPAHAALADRTQKQIGIPYVLLGGSLWQAGATFRRLGELTGRTAEAEQLALYSEGLLAKAREVVAKDPRRPRVYFGRNATGLETTLTGSLFAEVIEAAGAVNVAKRGNTDAIITMSFEAIMGGKPEVIVTQDENFAKLARTDATWRGLGARVLLAPKVPFGWLDSPPAVNRLLGLLWLVNELHPFGWDGKATVREFYQRMFHITLSDAQAAKVLAP